MACLQMYAWGEFFRRGVQGVRDQEGGVMARMTRARALLEALLFSGTAFVALASFGAYVVAGNTLSSAEA